MVAKQSSSSQSSRRINLSRRGAGRSARNVRVERGSKRSFSIPSIPTLPSIKDWLSVLIIVPVSFLFFGLLSLGLYYGYSKTLTHPSLRVKYVEVTGNTRLSSKEVIDILGLDSSQNIFSFSLNALEKLLSSNPWVEEVSIKRILPGSIIIVIKEREPVFWRLINGQLHYTGANGIPIAPVVAKNFVTLPTLEIEKGAEDSIALLPDIFLHLSNSSLPIELSDIKFIKISAAKTLELKTNQNSLSMLIGLEEYADNIERLRITLEDLQKRNELRYVREIKAEGVNVWVEKNA